MDVFEGDGEGDALVARGHPPIRVDLGQQQSFQPFALDVQDGGIAEVLYQRDPALEMGARRPLCTDLQMFGADPQLDAVLVGAVERGLRYGQRDPSARCQLSVFPLCSRQFAGQQVHFWHAEEGGHEFGGGALVEIQR